MWNSPVMSCVILYKLSLIIQNPAVQQNMQNYFDVDWIAGIIIVYLCSPVLFKNIEL